RIPQPLSASGHLRAGLLKQPFRRRFILLPCARLGQFITLGCRLPRSFHFAKIILRETLLLVERLHPLVLVAPPFEVDPGLFEFLWSRALFCFSKRRQRRGFLASGRFERIFVIRSLKFRQRLPWLYLLSFIDKHAGHSAWNREAKVPCAF